MLAEVFDRQGVDYEGLNETERVEFLTDAILTDETLIDVTDTERVSDTAARVLTRFENFTDWRQEYGVDAIDTY
jgi:phosphoenolpyruvate carboxylase